MGNPLLLPLPVCPLLPAVTRKVGDKCGYAGPAGRDEVTRKRNIPPRPGAAAVGTRRVQAPADALGRAPRARCTSAIAPRHRNERKDEERRKGNVPDYVNRSFRVVNRCVAFSFPGDEKKKEALRENYV